MGRREPLAVFVVHEMALARVEEAACSASGESTGRVNSYVLAGAAGLKRRMVTLKCFSCMQGPLVFVRCRQADDFGAASGEHDAQDR